MTENSMSDGLLAALQQTPKKSDRKPKPLGKSGEPSTSKSNATRAATGQTPQPKPRNNAEKLQAVTDLLSGKTTDDKSPTEGEQPNTDAGASSTDTSEGDANVPNEAPNASTPTLEGDVGELSVKELAERLGTSPKKLYESIQITTGDGETLTLGEVKDRVTSQEAATREIVKRETAISERESAMLQNMQLLQSVMGDLKGKLDPATIQQLQQRTAEQEARERNLMLQTMPELADPAQLDTFRTEAAEYMQEFGFRPNELVIRDHRIALAIRDAIKTKRQLKKLMEFQPEQTPPKAHKPQGKRKPPNRTAETIANARNSTRPQDKAAAANAILRGANNA